MKPRIATATHHRSTRSGRTPPPFFVIHGANDSGRLSQRGRPVRCRASRNLRGSRRLRPDPWGDARIRCGLLGADAPRCQRDRKIPQRSQAINSRQRVGTPPAGLPVSSVGSAWGRARLRLCRGRWPCGLLADSPQPVSGRRERRAASAGPRQRVPDPGSGHARVPARSRLPLRPLL